MHFNLLHVAKLMHAVHAEFTVQKCNKQLAILGSLIVL